MVELACAADYTKPVQLYNERTESSILVRMILFRSGPSGPDRRRFIFNEQGPPTAGPAYLRIKAWVLAQISGGILNEGDPVPSEARLAMQFGVSRMTVNRAMRELRDEGVVVRVQGSGTFVARSKYESTVVAIRSIDEEIRSRGHVHRSEMQRRERCVADELLAEAFALPPGTALYHSVMLHFENGEPIQVEDRYVNPAVAPGYIDAHFAHETPSAYLMREAPLSSVQFAIEACAAPDEIAAWLRIGAGDAALVLRRRTLSQHHVASVVAMWHPSDRFQFTGSF